MNGHLTKEELEALDSVQFNFVNTTDAPIAPDLFNIDVLANTPTEPQYIVPPFGIDMTQAMGTPVETVSNPNNGNTYTTSNSGQTVEVYDPSGTFITSIALGAGFNPFGIVYNSVKNSMYVSSGNLNRIVEIDCATNTIVATILGFIADLGFMAYNSINNTIYVSVQGSTVDVVNCTTNTIIGTINIVTGQPNWITFNPDSNVVYISSNADTSLRKVDCNTNTIVGLIDIVAGSPDGSAYASDSKKLYVGTNTGDIVAVIDTSTDTLLKQIAFTVGSMPIDVAYDPNLNYIYVGHNAVNQITIINGGNDSILTTIAPSTKPSTIFYDTFARRILISVPLANTVYGISTNGVTSNPLYVTGSSDYNCFVRNLETEPILLLGMWVISESQIQLANPLNIRTKSADGRSKVMPDFPSLQVSTYQEQGNRALILFGDKTVFDGRTFFSEYNIQSNQQVTFILLYDQFNRANFSLKDGWMKKPLLYGISGDRAYIDTNHNEVRDKYDENYGE